MAWLLLLLWCGVGVGCGPSGTPEQAVESAMCAFARLDAVGMEHYLCVESGISLAALRAGMAQTRSQGAGIELCDMRYELVERNADHARVRMTGIILADHPTQGPTREQLDEVVPCRVEQGRWKVCGPLL
jgi:hypothetical protein